MEEDRPGKKVARLVDAIFFSSVQESFIALALGYLLSVIYLIGDTRQLTPLLAGIIAGTIIFTIVSTLAGEFGRRKFAGETLVIVILLSISAYIIADLLVFHTGYQYSDLFLAVIGAMIISPVMLVQQYSQLIFRVNRIASKATVSSISSVLMIVIIVLFAFVYEKGGQTMLSEKVEVIGTISIVLTLIEIGIIRRL